MDTNIRRDNEKFQLFYRHFNRAVNPSYHQKGFTLLEVMHAVVLFGLLSVAIMLVSSSFSHMSHQFRADVNLTNQARVALDTMVWGYHAEGEVSRHGIWESSSYTLPSDSEIDFTDPDGDERIFRQNGLKIQYVDENNAVFTLYDPNGAVADDPQIYSTDLTFQTTGGVVQVDLVLGRNISGRWYYASSSTQVNTRN